MSKKCPKCESIAVVYEDYVGGTSFYRCQTCGYRGSDFALPTVFDCITASPEVLAEKFVYETQEFFYDDDHKPIPNHTYYVSLLLVSEVTGRKIYFETREQAVAATVARLKEVAK
jgi:hypothetical protein